MALTGVETAERALGLGAVGSGAGTKSPARVKSPVGSTTPVKSMTPTRSMSPTGARSPPLSKTKSPPNGTTAREVLSAGVSALGLGKTTGGKGAEDDHGREMRDMAVREMEVEMQ